MSRVVYAVETWSNQYLLNHSNGEQSKDVCFVGVWDNYDKAKEWCGLNPEWLDEDYHWAISTLPINVYGEDRIIDHYTREMTPCNYTGKVLSSFKQNNEAQLDENHIRQINQDLGDLLSRVDELEEKLDEILNLVKSRSSSKKVLEPLFEDE